MKINIGGGQCYNCTGANLINVETPSGLLESNLLLNVEISKVECRGLFVARGIPGLHDILLQPQININIQTILAVQTTTLQIVNIRNVFCNFTYDKFSYNFVLPGNYVINVEEITVLHVNGNQTFLGTANTNEDVNFLNINAPTDFATSKFIFNEFFTTGQIAQINGGTQVHFEILNITNFATNTNLPAFNIIGGQVILILHSGQFEYNDGISIIDNNGQLFLTFNSILNLEVANSTIIQNNGFMHIKSNVLSSNQDNIVMINNTGTLNINVNQIFVNGQDSIFLISENLVNTNILQISINNTNSSCFEINNFGELNGFIGSASTANNDIFRFNDSSSANLIINNMFGNADRMIRFSTTGTIVMNINKINSTTNNTTFGIFEIRQDNSIVNLKINEMSIQSASYGIYSGGSNSIINIDIQKFIANGEITNGCIYVDDGLLNIFGNFYNYSTNVSPLFFNNNGTFNGNFGFAESNYEILTTRSSRNTSIYAKNARSINGANNITILSPSNGEIITVEGYYTTLGDHNIIIDSGSPGYLRVLNAYLISNSINIISNGPPFIFGCNHGVGNNGLLNVIDSPPGTFLVDPTLQ